MSDNPNPAGPDAENPKDGDPAEGTGGAPVGDHEKGDQGEGEAELGDAGKKALKTERDARKSAEKKAADLEAEISRLRRANAAQKGTDVDAIKEEIRAEFTAQLAETAIKAEAKGRLQDPADALLYIKPADVAGDESAVKAAVDKLLQDKPYLAVESGPKPWGDVGGGQRKTSEAEPKTAYERMLRAYDSK